MKNNTKAPLSPKDFLQKLSACVASGEGFYTTYFDKDLCSIVFRHKEWSIKAEIKYPDNLKKDCSKPNNLPNLLHSIDFKSLRDGHHQAVDSSYLANDDDKASLYDIAEKILRNPADSQEDPEPIILDEVELYQYPGLYHVVIDKIQNTSISESYETEDERRRVVMRFTRTPEDINQDEDLAKSILNSRLGEGNYDFNTESVNFEDILMCTDFVEVVSVTPLKNEVAG